MNDLISRQAAIGALDKQIEQCDKALSSFDISMRDEFAAKVERASLVAFRETLEYLPSEEPKRGKWILDRSGAYCCSECMEPCATFVLMKPRDKFCKMCGSRNEVTE